MIFKFEKDSFKAKRNQIIKKKKKIENSSKSVAAISVYIYSSINEHMSLNESLKYENKYLNFQTLTYIIIFLINYQGGFEINKKIGFDSQKFFSAFRGWGLFLKL